MEPLTIVLIILCAVLACTAGYLVISRWKAWPDATRSAVVTALYALAKTVADAVKDAKLTTEELKGIFTQILAVIAAASGRTLDEVESEFA